MRNLCFIVRPLQFSEIAHKSLKKSIPPSPLFLFSQASLFFFLSHRQRLHPNPFSLPPFPCSASGPAIKRGASAPMTAGGAAQGSARQALGEAAAGAGGGAEAGGAGPSRAAVRGR
jgi:hypothetical protein